MSSLVSPALLFHSLCSEEVHSAPRLLQTNLEISRPNHGPFLAHTTCPTLCWGAGGVCQGRCSCSGTQPPSAMSSGATAGKTHLESYTLSRPHFNQVMTSVPFAHSPLARISHMVCPSQGRGLTGKCGVWLTVWQASP